MIIFDLDGTLADVSHRRHYVEGKRKNFDRFFEAMDDDGLIEAVAYTYRTFHAAGEVIAVLSGRPDRYKSRTRAWMERFNLPEPHILMMRPAEQEYDSDADVKRDMLKTIQAQGYEPKMVFDDRRRVVEMWRAEGIACFQVEDGDF